MKKLLIILSILIIGFTSYAQDVVGGRIIAKNSLFVRDRWVDTITVDTSKFLNYNRSIPTAGAVYEFVNARMSGGGGGGSGTVTSAAMTVPSFLSVSGSPITTSGTFAVTLSGTALPAINGGTGQISYAVGDLLYASTTTALSKLAAGTATHVLTSNGAGVAPSWQAIPSDNLIVQNAGSGTQTWFTSGDTLYMKRIKNATITATTDTDSSLLLNVTDADRGDITVSSTGTTWTIDNDIVTYAKFQNVGANEVLGRASGSSGDISGIAIGASQLFGRGATGDLTAITLGTNLSMSGTTLNATGGGGGGDVTKVGTPVNNQLGIWTGDGTIEGDANLTFASSTLNIGVAGASTGIFTQSGVTSGTITFQPASAAGTYTLTWPTTDGDASQVLTTNGSGVLSWTTPSGSGSVSSGTQYRIGYYATTGTTISEAAAITANRALISDANGVPTHSSVTNTELGYVSGVTSAIQTQLDGKQTKDIGIIQSSTYTLTSTTSTQKLFDAVTNGEITVSANTTYEFECLFALKSMSATSGNCGFDVLGAGTATFTSVNWVGNTRDVTLGGAAAGSNIYAETAAITNNIAQASTATEFFAHIKGIIRVNAGGTIIPSTNLTTAAAAVVQPNSYFKLTPIGSGSITSW